MKMTNLAWLILAVFLAGCATSKIPDVATHFDRSTGTRVDLIPENLLESPLDPPRELVWLNASRVFKDREDFDYYLEVHYEAMEETGLLDIIPGDSLIIIADDRQLRFRGTGSLNARRQKGGTITEDAIYLASANELRAIAYARRVEVHIIGRNGRIIRDFRPENFEKFKKFVHAYVEGGA